MVVGGDNIIGVFEINGFNFLSVFIAGSNVFKHRVQRRDQNGGGIHEGLGVQGNDGLPWTSSWLSSRRVAHFSTE